MATASSSTRSPAPLYNGGSFSPRQQPPQQPVDGPPKITRSETALSWFRRCQQKRLQQRRLVDAPPTDPASAAWAFFRSTTKIPFVDESLRCHQHYNQLPALEIRDHVDHSHNTSGGGTGKTRTLLSLAARFVVSTRPSLFASSSSSSSSSKQTNTTTSSSAAVDDAANDNNENNPQQATATHTTATAPPETPLPRVILLDSTMDVTDLKLAYAVSSLLLRESNVDSDNDETLALEQDIPCCLSRIHVAHSDNPNDISGWVPLLESIRCELLMEQQQQQQERNNNNNNHKNNNQNDNDHQHQQPESLVFPTLLLWDGFLSETTDPGGRMEVTRQLARLMRDCPVGFMYTTTTTTSNSSTLWNHHHFNVGRSLQVHEKELGGQQQEQQGVHLFPTSSSGHYCYNSVGPIAQTVRLERDESEGRRHDFMATVSPGNTQIVYSLSAAGVLR